MVTLEVALTNGLELETAVAITIKQATEIQRPGDGTRTFAIRGKAAGSSSVTDFFWAYGNSGSGGDAINYTGLTTQDNHIATKKYVDSKMPAYKITQSNGNYYVS